MMFDIITIVTLHCLNNVAAASHGSKEYNSADTASMNVAEKLEDDPTNKFNSCILWNNHNIQINFIDYLPKLRASH